MKYCLDCGFVGEPEQYTPGTLSKEIGLWCFFIVPGIIYSVWRSLCQHERCAICGNRRLVTTSSQAAQTAISKLSPPLAGPGWFCRGCGEPIFNTGSFCVRCEGTPSVGESARSAPQHLSLL
jgi:hypothetical protein